MLEISPNALSALGAKYRILRMTPSVDQICLVDLSSYLIFLSGREWYAVNI